MNFLMIHIREDTRGFLFCQVGSDRIYRRVRAIRCSNGRFYTIPFPLVGEFVSPQMTRVAVWKK